MNLRTVIAAAMAATLLVTAAGCAVQRGQQTVGAYVDDAGITASVKSAFVGNKSVDANSISVETLNGTVMLSGFAKNAAEKSEAEAVAWKAKGVKDVKNEITIRP